MRRLNAPRFMERDCLFLIIILLAVLPAIGFAEWPITQLTDGAEEDYGPHISGGNIVWESWDGSDGEIFFWSGSTTTQLTDNSGDDGDPQISGGNVVWVGYDGSDSEIFFWNGSTYASAIFTPYQTL